MRVAVTGVAGHVGGFLARELDGAGHEVVGVDLVEPSGLPLARFARADVASQAELGDAFAGCDAIVHLAAIRDLGMAPDAVLFQVNVVGTFNALEAAVAAGVPRFVFASSEAVAGMGGDDAKPDYLPIDEQHPLRPSDVYALSKVLGEELCRSYATRGALSAVCLRTAYVFSLDEWQANGYSLEQWREAAQKSPEIGRRGIWSYVDARDAARAYRLACEVEGVRYEAVFVVANDIFAVSPLAELVHHQLPDVPVRVPLGELDSIISWARANAVLGYEPCYRLRDQIAPGAGTAAGPA
jgi:nucleoside-diphosphate-sugar epimerase